MGKIGEWASWLFFMILFSILLFGICKATMTAFEIGTLQFWSFDGFVVCLAIFLSVFALAFGFSKRVVPWKVE